MIWIKQARHFIRGKRRQYDRHIEGGSHMYILALYLMLFMFVVFKLMMDRERVYITYDTVDDSIVEALLSSCVINTEEYGRGEQLVIYETITPPKQTSIFDQMQNLGPGGVPLPPPPPYDPLTDSAIWNPGRDEYLTDSYEMFEENLKRNLKLDDSMTATISGIEGIIVIEEFAIYNVYQAFDDSGNETGRRVVKYTPTDSGIWTAYPYSIDEDVKVYNSLDKQDVTIEATSVVARLSFDAVVGDYSEWLMPGKAESDMIKHVTYQRVVDITEG